VRIDEATLFALCTALSAQLDGSKIQKVRQPLPEVLSFDVHPSIEKRRLVISCDRTFGFIGLVRTRLPNPLEPPRFSCLLRKHLVGLRLRKFEAVVGDRIVRIHFNSSHDSILPWLELRLFGNRPNLLLFSGSGVPLGKLNDYSKHKGPIDDDPDFAAVTASPQCPITRKSAPSLGDCATNETLFDKAEENYFTAAINSRIDTLRLSLERDLTRARKRLSKRKTSLLDARKATAKAEDYFHRGELLKTVLAQIRPRMTSITVFDWKTNAMIDLPLEPKLDAKGQLERLFKKAKKCKRGGPVIEERFRACVAELDALEQVQVRLEKAQTIESLLDIRQSLQAADLVAVKKKAPKRPNERRRPHPGVRRFTSSDGYRIFVGRNARANEYLSTKLCKIRDLWFHAQDAAGAHVLIRVPDQRPVPAQTITEAAQLAAHFSKRRFDTRVEVHRTTGSEVRRPHGAPTGTVTLRHSTTMVVRPDPTLVARLIDAGVEKEDQEQ